MATTTTNYGLTKPAYDDVADVGVINSNMDIIDEQIKKNEDGISQSKGIVSDEYSDSSTYNIGDYCIYENKLYKCVTAVTTEEVFDSAKWEETSVKSELSTLSSNLYNWIPKNNFIIKSDTDHTNITQIDRNNPNHELNQPHLVHQTSTGTPLTGMPSELTGGFLGIRYVHYFDANNIVIELRTLGAHFKIYYRAYNGTGWGNWYKVTPTQLS